MYELIRNWSGYNKAQVNEKSEFMRILHDLCKTIPKREKKLGRPPLPLSDMVFACTLKVFSNNSGRRFMSDLKLAKRMGLIQKLPHYNSVFHYFQKPEMTDILKELIEKLVLL